MEAVNHKNALALHVDYTSDAISKEPVGECASFPLTRGHIECEAIGGVWSPRPPPTTDSQLWCLGGGDERTKAIAGLRKRRDGAIFKAECLNRRKLPLT